MKLVQFKAYSVKEYKAKVAAMKELGLEFVSAEFEGYFSTLPTNLDDRIPDDNFYAPGPFQYLSVGTTWITILSPNSDLLGTRVRFPSSPRSLAHNPYLLINARIK